MISLSNTRATLSSVLRLLLLLSALGDEQAETKRIAVRQHRSMRGVDRFWEEGQGMVCFRVRQLALRRASRG